VTNDLKMAGGGAPGHVLHAHAGFLLAALAHEHMSSSRFPSTTASFRDAAARPLLGCHFLQSTWRQALM